MVSKSDLKTPLSGLTKLRQEEVKEYKRAEEEERIEVLGQESDRKAIPWVQKDVSEQEKKDKEYFYLIMELLNKHKNKKLAYLRILGRVFTHFLEQEYIPKKYFVDIEINDTGVKAELKGTKYYGAFKPSGLSSYDFRTCQMLAIKVGNTIGKLEGYNRKSDGGVLLPDDEDRRVYG